MKVRSTIKRTHTIKAGQEIVGVLWEAGPTIALNPAHVVSQVPFTWSDDKGNSVHGLEIRTVLGETFHIATGTFL